MSALVDKLQSGIGLPLRPARVLGMLYSARGMVASTLLLREALRRRCDMESVFGEVKRIRDRLSAVNAPEGVISVHGLGYRMTPDLRDWVSARVPA